MPRLRTKTVVFAILLNLAGALFSQPYGKGEVFDQAAYDRLPRKAVQATRAYTALPARVSLKGYAPSPGDQGPYGTCTAWATGYAARTIAESVALKRADAGLTTDSVFSPVFIYKNLSKDPSCQSGTSIHNALELMKGEGAAKRLEIEKTMDFAAIPLTYYSGERRYTIAGFSTLIFSMANGGDISKHDMVKKALAENKPVLISLNCPDSFHSARDVWWPTEDPKKDHGGHALCVIGYDDDRSGGVFEILNSWGEYWGDHGYIWIPYTVFGQFVRGAYEITDNIAAYGEQNAFSGSVHIEPHGYADMPIQFQAGYYETIESYPAGTRFRYLLENDQPSYVYAFAADDTRNPSTMIFPNDLDGPPVSPLLDYSENIVVLPDERTWIQLDDRRGHDYLVVLYSKEDLDCDAIRRDFDQARGSFSERVAAAVGPNYIPPTLARYDPSAMKFKSVTGNSKAVFGLLLAIKHK